VETARPLRIDSVDPLQQGSCQPSLVFAMLRNDLGGSHHPSSYDGLAPHRGRLQALSNGSGLSLSQSLAPREVPLTVRRGNKALTLKVVLSERPRSP
jgi:hypothetical protein